MATSAADIPREPQTSRDSQREQTRERMLQAVLDIIVEQGMRAVRHRAVAKRAGVSLGSTTYHFSSIEDLIISAFEYFNRQQMMAVNPYYHEVIERLAPFEDGVVPSSLRPEMAAWISEQSVGYVCNQLEGKNYFDRVVEFAFYHESIRYPSLKEQLIKVRETELDFLAKVHRIMGSPQPREDARITVALFRQLEQSVIMAVPPGLDADVIRRTIERHLSLCFDIPPTPAASVGS